MTELGKTRILLAKIGLDAHNIGVTYLARFLRDAGMEVIYLGLYGTADKVVSAAVEEDVDIIGLSFLGGDHMVLAPPVLKLLKKENANIPVIIGGVIPRQDFSTLQEMGVAGVFEAGTAPDKIVDSINDIMSKAYS
jgi:methylmalonyl-CoA mutase C-terminal domain/subunit